MRLYDGIRVLAITGTIAAGAAPAAQAVQPMQPSGDLSTAAPVATQQTDGSPDWVLIGAGAGAVALVGGVAVSRRTSWRTAHPRGSGVVR